MTGRAGKRQSPGAAARSRLCDPGVSRGVHRQVNGLDGAVAAGDHLATPAGLAPVVSVFPDRSPLQSRPRPYAHQTVPPVVTPTPLTIPLQNLPERLPDALQQPLISLPACST